MRNYVEMFFGEYLATQPPLSDVTIEIWRGDLDTFYTEEEHQRQIWTQAGWTFTNKTRTKAYWKLNKENFVAIITAFSVSNALKSYFNGADPIVTADSPRKSWSHNE